MGPLYRCVLWSSGLLVLVAQAGAGIASPVCAPRNWSSRSTNGRVAVQLTASLIPAAMTASPTCSPRASTRRSSGSSPASSSVKRLKSTRQRSSRAPTARTASPTSLKHSKTVCLGGVCVGGGARPTAMSLCPGEKGRRVLRSHLSSSSARKLNHAQQLPRRRGSALALRPQRLPSPLFPLLAHSMACASNRPLPGAKAACTGPGLDDRLSCPTL